LIFVETTIFLVIFYLSTWNRNCSTESNQFFSQTVACVNPIGTYIHSLQNKKSHFFFLFF
jgi:hypothetical protein